jgi:hypothetical protein
MSNTMFARLTVVALAAALAVGCNKEEPAMVPLGQAASPGLSPHGTTPSITGEAKVALDSGNKLYSAKSYRLALAQYRRAAALAPEAEAPLFGILMVANATQDARLTDSATAALRALNDSTSAEEVVDVHSRIGTPPPSQ